MAGMAAAMLLAAGPAMAGTPTEAVRPFYEHPGLERQEEALDRFVDPARKIFADSLALERSGAGECLDPNMTLDAPEYSEEELRRTLKLAEAVTGENAIVLATFTVNGEPRRIQWKLKRVGEEWMIADFISVTGEWSLSQYSCE